MSHRVVIIGAGFLGLLVTRRLRKLIGKEIELTIIDPKDYFLFTPRLIDALAGSHARGLKRELAPLLKKFGAHLIQSKVTAIDRNRQSISYTAVDDSSAKTIEYDQAVLAIGAETSDYQIPGVKEHTFHLKSFQDVARIQERIRQRMAEHSSPACVIVGAGATGVEALGALSRFAPQCSLSFIQGAPQILPGFPLSLVRRVEKILRASGAQLFIGESVQRVSATGIQTSKTSHISADLVVWCAGLQAPTINLAPSVERDPSGFFVVDAYLKLDNHLFAGGDIVSYREDNLTIPKNAQTSFLMAETIAKNILHRVRGEPLEPFRYSSKGNILWLGKTGILDFKFFCIQTRWTGFVRDLFYHFRSWQILG